MKKSPEDPGGCGLPLCTSCSLHESSLFGALDDRDLEPLRHLIKLVEFQPGEVIFRAGDTPIYLFTIRTGLIKLVRYLPDGSQRILHLLQGGKLAGLETTDVTGAAVYDLNAVALQATTACRIPRQKVLELMAKTPRLYERLLKRWHTALSDAQNNLFDLSTGKAPRRLARLLLRFAGSDGVAPLLPREDLGALLGITMEHASRTLADFKRNHWVVELSRYECRCDLPALELLASSDD